MSNCGGPVKPGRIPVFRRCRRAVAAGIALLAAAGVANVAAAPVVGEKSFTGFAPVMNVITTMTDGVTVTNQVQVPAYLVPVPPAATLIDLPPNTTNITTTSHVSPRQPT